MEPNEYPGVKEIDSDIADAERRLAELKQAREVALAQAEAEKEDAPRLISELVDAAYAKIAEAEKIADRTGTSFRFSLEYGMGGEYRPAGSKDWTNSYEERTVGSWSSSSSDC